MFCSPFITHDTLILVTKLHTHLWGVPFEGKTRGWDRNTTHILKCHLCSNSELRQVAMLTLSRLSYNLFKKAQVTIIWLIPVHTVRWFLKHLFSRLVNL